MGDEAGDGFTHSFAGGDTLADPFIEGVVIERLGETFGSGFVVKAGGVNHAAYGIAGTLDDHIAAMFRDAGGQFNNLFAGCCDFIISPGDGGGIIGGLGDSGIGLESQLDSFVSDAVSFGISSFDYLVL